MVTDCIYFCIGVFFLLIHHSDVFRRGFRLLTEQGNDGLCIIVIHIGLVEAIEHLHLMFRRNTDLTKILLAEESFDHSLVALQILADDLLRILVAVVFRLHLILAIQDKRLQIERGLQGTVAQADGLHWLAAQLLVRKHHAVPGKHRITLQP